LFLIFYSFPFGRFFLIARFLFFAFVLPLFIPMLFVLAFLFSGYFFLFLDPFPRKSPGKNGKEELGLHLKFTSFRLIRLQ
jgi:hypothetical protein